MIEWWPARNASFMRSGMCVELWSDQGVGSKNGSVSVKTACFDLEAVIEVQGVKVGPKRSHVVLQNLRVERSKSRALSCDFNTSASSESELTLVFEKPGQFKLPLLDITRIRCTYLLQGKASIEAKGALVLLSAASQNDLERLLHLIKDVKSGKEPADSRFCSACKEKAASGPTNKAKQKREDQVSTDCTPTCKVGADCQATKKQKKIQHYFKSKENEHPAHKPRKMGMPPAQASEAGPMDARDDVYNGCAKNVERSPIKQSNGSCNSPVQYLHKLREPRDVKSTSPDSKSVCIDERKTRNSAEGMARREKLRIMSERGRDAGISIRMNEEKENYDSRMGQDIKKSAEEAMKKQTEERRRVEEEQKRVLEDSKSRLLEDERRDVRKMVEDVERRQLEERNRKFQEDTRRKEEMRKLVDEERRRLNEWEAQKKQEEKNAREVRKQNEEEERLKKLEEEWRQEQKRKEEEKQLELKKAEEERQKILLAELKLREEEKRQEEKRREEERRQEEKRKEEEKRVMLRKQKEEEEQRLQEQLQEQWRKQEEARRKEEQLQEQRRKQEEERWKEEQLQEQRRKQEEEIWKQVEERRKQVEERRKQDLEFLQEQRRKQDEERRKQELLQEQRRKQEEKRNQEQVLEQRRKHEERKRQQLLQDQKRKQDEEKLLEQMQELRRKQEEDDKRRQEQSHQGFEEMRRKYEQERQEALLRRSKIDEDQHTANVVKKQEEHKQFLEEFSNMVRIQDQERRAKMEEYTRFVEGGNQDPEGKNREEKGNEAFKMFGDIERKKREEKNDESYRRLFDEQRLRNEGRKLNEEINTRKKEENQRRFGEDRNKMSDQQPLNLEDQRRRVEEVMKQSRILARKRMEESVKEKRKEPATVDNTPLDLNVTKKIVDETNDLMILEEIRIRLTQQCRVEEVSGRNKLFPDEVKLVSDLLLRLEQKRRTLMDIQEGRERAWRAEEQVNLRNATLKETIAKSERAKLEELRKQELERKKTEKAANALNKKILLDQMKAARAEAKRIERAVKEALKRAKAEERAAQQKKAQEEAKQRAHEQAKQQAHEQAKQQAHEQAKQRAATNGPANGALPPATIRVPILTYQQYEELWNVMKLSRNGSPLGYLDIPWPPQGNPLFIELGDTADTQRRKLKAALLRWHPDKFTALCGDRLQPLEKESIELQAKCLAQEVIQWKIKLSVVTELKL